MLSRYETHTPQSHCTTPPYGPSLVDTLSCEGFDQASAEISTWDGYHPTPMPDLSNLAGKLGIAALHYKDEGGRFGLGSFKALGGAYAVLRLLQRDLSSQMGRPVSANEIKSGAFAEKIAAITVISATDGNHGRSVAWGAQQFGARCRIYIHAEVSAHRAKAMERLGAEVIRVNGDYDATVAQTRVDADKNGWKIVSDTSWPGYVQPPLDVMAGYGLMAREIVQDLDLPPTHVFLQGGVGGLAAAVIAVFHQEWGDMAPKSIMVEPELAPCLYASGMANAPTSVEIHQETLMAGLSCGEPSELAWNVLSQAVSCFMTIPETLVAPTVRLLANAETGDDPIQAGESAIAGLVGAICGALQPKLRDDLGLNTNSRVIIIGSEGVTDPNVYAQILAGQI